MASLTATVLLPRRPDDPLAAIRRNNKRLIIAFFLLILTVAAVTGAIIVYLVHDLNQKNSSTPIAGIQEICSFIHTSSTCINFLSHTIHAGPDSTPTEILRLSLQAALDEVSRLRPLLPPSDSTSFPKPRFRTTVRNCAGWIRLSEAELGNATRLMWPDPDEATREVLLMAVDAARGGVGRCREAVEMFLVDASEVETRKLHPPRAAVEKVSQLLYYGVVSIRNMDAVNENYYARLRGEGLSGAVDDVVGVVTLYAVPYAVLVFLFCLLLRIA